MTGLLDKPESPAVYQPLPQRTPVSVNLLPPEITADRRSRRLRRRVVAAVVVAGLLLTAGEFVARHDTAAAQSLATAATARGAALKQQEGAFKELLATKQASAQLAGTLAGLLADDLPWWKLLPALQAAAPAGASIASVVGNLTEPTAGPAAAPLLGDQSAVGSLTVVGKAPDKDAVAQFADRLAGTAGLTNVYVTSVTAGDGGSYQFTVQIQITAAARGGRFTPVAGK